MAALASRMEASLRNDPQGVLEPRALEEASLLAELIGGRDTRDVEGAMFLATFHLHRWQRLPAGEDAWDAEQMRAWLAVVSAIDPRLLPPPVRSMAALGGLAGPAADVHSLNAEAASLATRFEQTGETGLLDRAIELWRSALPLLRPDQRAPRATILINLSGALTTRAEINGSREDADEAVAAASEAVQISPPGHQLHASALAHHGIALKNRFGLRGQRADLAEALTAARSAVADDYSAHPARSKFLANLADMLRIGFEFDGRLADLDDAVTLNLKALSAATPDEAAVIQANLCGVLQLRFEQTQERADLDEAVRLGRSAVAATPPGHPALARRLYILSAALQSRVRFPGQTGDIAEAVRVARQAVAAATDGHPARGMCLSNLAASLRLQLSIGEVLGTVAPGRRDRDLAEAITSIRAAYDSEAAAHPDRARYLNALGILLRMRGSAADLDEAVTVAAEAVAETPDGHYDWCPHMSNLGNAREARFLMSSRPGDFDAAVGAWKKAAKAPAGESQVRLAAAIAWGRLAAAENDAANAAEGFGYAVSLLPIVAWRGLERGVREENLARWEGLASDAAAWAIRNGEPERAVELLEQGRSVLWTQQLHLRSDLDKLTEVSDDLKDQLNRIRGTLDSPGRHHDITGPRPSSEYEPAAARHRRDAERWDALVAQARELVGQDFLAPVPFGELHRAAAGGPVVILNTSRYGCDALAVEANGVRCIPLPALRHDELASRTKSMLTALREQGDVLDETLTGLLGWLWTTVANPVLDTLNLTGRLDLTDPDATRERRLWWCPTGLLSFLPLHAAGRYDRELEAVPERVISSYTSTLGMLIHARQRRAAGVRRPLLVGVPDAPGASRLLGVSAEIEQTRQILATADGLGGITVLAGRDAVGRRVLDEMASHDWVHLACHGYQDVNDPAAGSIILSDGPLPILDIADQQLADHDLAFLSACHTFTGVLPLADEAIHIASAFQAAGYRHVIATLWWIMDFRAPQVASSVYRTLCHDGTADADRAAEAIHLATAEQRAASPGQPRLWAAYAHIGP